ncbi:MAG: hypothetical protein D6788_10120, partial [Planctomycetota bacterium]
LALHAWVNVMPAWRGRRPPGDPRQLYNARPEWFLRDARGNRQPLGWYNSLNPCLPEVRRYLTAVMEEIVRGYDVDGLHLDYIRFPNEWTESYGRGRSVPDYPRDPRTLAMFRRETGTTPDRDPQRWTAWRADKVTQLLRDIRRAVKRIRPGVQLSAAVGAEPAEAYRRHYQDALRWIREGLLDAVYPMNYTSDAATFERRARLWASQQSKVTVVMGIRFDGRDGRTVAEQLRRSRAVCPHFAAFAYNALFERPGASRRAVRDEAGVRRTALRREIVPLLRRTARKRR